MSERKYDVEMPGIYESGSCAARPIAYDGDDVLAMRDKAQDVIDGLRDHISLMSANAADNYAASENRLHECEAKLAAEREKLEQSRKHQLDLQYLLDASEALNSKAREKALREAASKAQICAAWFEGKSGEDMSGHIAEEILALIEPKV